MAKRSAPQRLVVQQEVEDTLEVVLGVIRDLDLAAAVFAVLDRHLRAEEVAERAGELPDLERILVRRRDRLGGFFGGFFRIGRFLVEPLPVFADQRLDLADREAAFDDALVQVKLGLIVFDGDAVVTDDDGNAVVTSAVGAGVAP